MVSSQSYHSLSSVMVRQVELLRRQYLQLVDPEQLKLPATEILRLPEAQTKIFDDIFNDKFRSFPSPKRYKFRVLKRIVDAVELSIVDPEEDVGSPLSSPTARFHVKSKLLILLHPSRQCIHCLTDSARKSLMT